MYDLKAYLWDFEASNQTRICAVTLVLTKEALQPCRWWWDRWSVLTTPDSISGTAPKVLLEFISQAWAHLGGEFHVSRNVAYIYIRNKSQHLPNQKKLSGRIASNQSNPQNRREVQRQAGPYLISIGFRELTGRVLLISKKWRDAARIFPLWDTSQGFVSLRFAVPILGVSPRVMPVQNNFAFIQSTRAQSHKLTHLSVMEEAPPIDDALQIRVNNTRLEARQLQTCNWILRRIGTMNFLEHCTEWWESKTQWDPSG